jgi:hypothetical protein
MATASPVAAETTAEPAATSSYETDLVAWAEVNAALLRQGRLSEIDAEHIAEELEDMGKSERRALASQLRNLMLHLLKWQHQQGLRSASWRRSIQNARREIQVILSDSPSLKSRLATFVGEEYPPAVRLAVTETALPVQSFPAACPYSTDQLLDDNWWPLAIGETGC